jgi:hypothetical protein
LTIARKPGILVPESRKEETAMNSVWVILNEERPEVVSVFGVYASREAAHRALKNAPSGCWVDSPVDGDPVED